MVLDGYSCELSSEVLGYEYEHLVIRSTRPAARQCRLVPGPAFSLFWTRSTFSRVSTNHTGGMILNTITAHGETSGDLQFVDNFIRCDGGIILYLARSLCRCGLLQVLIVFVFSAFVTRHKPFIYSTRPAWRLASGPSQPWPFVPSRTDEPSSPSARARSASCPFRPSSYQWLPSRTC